MPALKRSPSQENRARTSACISRYMELRGVTADRLAAGFGVTVRTIENWRTHPERMKLEDIWEMSRMLKCPIGELAGGELPEETIGRLIKAAINAN